MSQHFQVAALVGSPSYPNAVTWSEENLVAVASGRLVTILNPAMPSGPRGVINVPAGEPFPIGVIERKDLLSDCLLPTSLSRDNGPCVRSISWSPIGLAPNSGCLLAVCTAHGHLKLYRMPFCEYFADWIEVLDLSEMLHSYFRNICFEESAIVPLEISDERSSRVTDDQQLSALTKGKRKRHNSLNRVKCQADNTKENSQLPLISPEQYACRLATLYSLVVSWSPILHVSPEIRGVSVDDSSTNFSILAVGAKSGQISFWRIHGPKSYTIKNSGEPTTALLAGFLKAHSSWITAISWSLCVFDSSKPQLLLVSGSSNGSVKIWQACTAELMKSSEVSQAPFSLVTEIMADDSVPVSTIALVMPVKSPNKLLVAVGKGSGSIDVWSCDIPTSKFERAGTYDAHDQIVTGLGWAFDGNCLYSCSQDNSFRSWILHGNFLCEAPIPSNTPGLRSSTDVPYAFDSCHGVAFSPGNLVIAVARGFDADLLHPMYQKRALKAAIEFLWIGGQQLEKSLICPDFDVESYPGFPIQELVCWENNILWCLNQYGILDKPLVAWDVTAALLAFKQSIPKYTERILLKWLGSFVGESFGSCISVLSEVSISLKKMTSRQLNLINIITKHVMLEELETNTINCRRLSVEETTVLEDEELNLWAELNVNSKMELQSRLVGFSFAAISILLSDSSTDFPRLGYWSPAGIAQMEQWVALNRRGAKDNIGLLGEDIKKVEKSQLQSLCEYSVEERCSLCSAIVPFESAEVAFCRGVERGTQSHKLERCAVSMQVCPTAPTWYCVSCHRRSSELVPKNFFSMHGYPSDFKSSVDSGVKVESLKPFCPFCGILLQRLLPDFLLSVSPV